MLKLVQTDHHIGSSANWLIITLAHWLIITLANSQFLVLHLAQCF